MHASTLFIPNPLINAVRRQSQKMANENETVVAYSNVKGAALYFPHVVPFITDHLAQAFLTCMSQELETKDDWTEEFVRSLEEDLPVDSPGLYSLLPPYLSRDKSFMQLIGKVPLWLFLNYFINRPSVSSVKGWERATEKKKAELESSLKKQLGVNVVHEKSLEVSLRTLMNRYELACLPAIFPDFIQDVVEPKLGLQSDTPEFRVSLINANLIDTRATSWEQILDFRNDVDSTKKLHRLRHFFSTNYFGKNQSYIEDDLQQRLEDHDLAIQKHGFHTKMTVWNALFTSK